MIQTVIVVLIFAAAVVYVGWMVLAAFQQKNGCNSGCGKCSAVDVTAIEKQLKEKGF